MLIGIIGAGLAGLTAGRKLAQAGHEVIVFEKSRGFGGRMATRYYGEEHQIKADHGLTTFTAEDPDFKSFVEELLQKGLVKSWGEAISYYNGVDFYSEHPMKETQPWYIAPKGMNSIGKYLKRWMDFYQGEKVGGVTYIGRNPQNKRPWMVNLTTINVIELDAVIVATPATQAYGIIQTAQDEKPVKRVITELDRLRYAHSWSLIAGYDGEYMPDWRAVSFTDPVLRMASNESRKRENGGETALVFQSTHEFTEKHQHSSSDTISREILKAAEPITGDWVRSPKWQDLHYWRYTRPLNPIDKPFIDFENEGAPFGLIGDYFQGDGLEAAYLSGKKLAEKWIKRYSRYSK